MKMTIQDIIDQYTSSTNTQSNVQSIDVRFVKKDTVLMLGNNRIIGIEVDEQIAYFLHENEKTSLFEDHDFHITDEIDVRIFKEL